MNAKQERVGWSVIVDCFPAVVFAETKQKAKFIAVSAYWEAFGKSGWPKITVRRRKEFDGHPLSKGPRRPYTYEHVELHAGWIPEMPYNGTTTKMEPVKISRS